MIEYLRIQNLALIKEMELEFSPGINVLTGETGAGKSFIIKALNFLTGDRPSSNMVRPGFDKATVEAVFVLPDSELLIRRELAAESGRSRIFINNALATQEELKTLKPTLMLHTSQHAQQRLLQAAYQEKIIDSFIKDQTLLAKRDELLKAIRAKIESRSALLAKCKELREKRELLEFQRREIELINPRKDEELELEERKTMIKNAGRSRSAVERIQSLLHGDGSGQSGLLDSLVALEREMAVMSGVNQAYQAYLPALEEARNTLKELGRSVKPDHREFFDEKDIEAIEARLFALAQLRRKLGRPLNEIVDLADEIEDNLQFLDACQLDIRRLEKEERHLLDQLSALLQELNQARRQAAEDFSRALMQQLSGLGFAAELKVETSFVSEEAFSGIIEEHPRVLWRPNPGQPAQPLDKIASGGELSRFLLALSGLQADTEDLPVLIFDEVDSGVGGLTLNKVAEHIEKLSMRQQIILITHWPRLAALPSRNSLRQQAGRHFQIVKEIIDNETYTSARLLYGQEVADELKRMAGGDDQAALLS